MTDAPPKLGGLSAIDAAELFTRSVTALQRSERSLNEIYVVAIRMYNRGMLRSDIRSRVHILRNQVFAMERAMRSAAIAGLHAVSPIASALDIGRVIPAPVRRPDLPRANVGRPPDRPMAVPTQGMLVEISDNISDSLRTTVGLGELGNPGAAVFAAVVIVVLGVVAASTIVAVVGVGEIGKIFRNGQRVDGNTQRFLAEMNATDSRYADCLRRGSTMKECSDLNPVPGAPQEAFGEGEDTFPWGLLLGGVGVVGGFMLWRRFAERDSE